MSASKICISHVMVLFFMLTSRHVNDQTQQLLSKIVLYFIIISFIISNKQLFRIGYSKNTERN